MKPKPLKTVKPKAVPTLDVDLESGMCLYPAVVSKRRQTTSIVDLMHNDALDLSSMTLDYTRINSKHTILTMTDYHTQKTLGIATEDQCWWDRHTFQTTPIGIPLKYSSYTEKKSYFTKKIEIKKKKGKEDVVVSETPMIKIDGVYENFETEGVVCSFPCALAFIRREVQHDKRYRESETLLYFMYKMLHDLPMEKRVNIPVAGSWKTISGCGGSVPINEFRHSFCRVVYDITPSVKRPLMVPMSRIVEVSPLN
jgi:hypothetical protein